MNQRFNKTKAAAIDLLDHVEALDQELLARADARLRHEHAGVADVASAVHIWGPQDSPLRGVFFRLPT